MEDNLYRFVVGAEQEGWRIDRFLAGQLEGATRSRIQQLIVDGRVQLNDGPAPKSARLKEGDVVSCDFPAPQQLEVKAEPIPLEIFYEDKDLLVVNKPKGMVVHPAPGNYTGTLVNALLYHCGAELSGINGVIRPGIVHRIDKDTSGLLIVAKNDKAHRFIAEQIAEHSFLREYRAVAVGSFRQSEGTIDAPIARHPRDRKKMAVCSDGKPAVTHYRVIRDYAGYSFISCRLETGRTHQIRVHMSYKGHPLFGDTVYGGGRTKLEIKNEALVKGQCLHAAILGFRHPDDGREMVFESGLPEYFQGVLSVLGAASGAADFNGYGE